MPGATVCDGNAVKTCGPDLTSLNTTTTCSANSHCEEGAPAGCKCDTGYTAGSGGTCANANDCADNPCGPSGSGNTCTDALNDFSCTCGNNYWARGDNKACISRFDHVSAGGNRTCAIRRDRTVACWGEGTDGSSSSPVTIAGINDATQISVGLDHACVLRSGGTVMCWGRNNHGQLGNGDNTDSLTTPVTVTVLNGNDVTQISAGGGFTCAVRAGNLITNPRTYCWGDNSVGQLGINSTQASFNRPQPITANNSNYDLVVAGARHACGRRGSNNHSVYCWGANNHGQLGNNGTADRVNAPVAATGQAASNVDQIAAGTDFTCVRKGGNVYCWGVPIGADGANVLTPTQVTGLTDAAQISAGAAGAHVCALKSGSSGNVVCWGSGADGQLGNGNGDSSVTPIAIGGSVTGFREVSAGSRHTCAVRSGSDGDILCWGEGSSGELGNGMKNDSPAPVAVVH
jgi:alpha-tubulin suppressor-like RCC1 family protein